MQGLGCGGLLPSVLHFRRYTNGSNPVAIANQSIDPKVMPNRGPKLPG